jgi:hypothetical protein
MATSNTTTQTAQKLAEETTRQLEQGAERVKEFNAGLVESSKSATRVGVDNYEKAAKSVFDLQRQMAGTSQVEWVKSVANTQIQLAEDMTVAWTKAARELLK